MIAISSIVLEYLCLSHLLTNNRLSISSKKGWIFGFITVGIIAAIVYYVKEYRKVDVEESNRNEYITCSKCGNSMPKNSPVCTVCGKLQVR